MAIWRDHLLPRITDKPCARHDIAAPRRRTLSGLSGDVVEVGFGSGHNLAYYPSEIDQFHRTGSAPSRPPGRSSSTSAGSNNANAMARFRQRP